MTKPQRGHLETLPHVLKAVLHNEEHPNETPHGPEPPRAQGYRRRGP